MTVSTSSSWCFHKINGPTAESMLITHGIEGAFLLRPSSKSRDTNGLNSTVLSILFRGKVIHVKIVSNGEFYQLEGDSEQFASTFEIISHYRAGKNSLNLSNGIQVRLSQPIFKDNPEFLEDRWFHRNLNCKQAAGLLDGKPEGSFLVRLAAHGEPLYVITMVGPEGNAVNVRIRRSLDSRQSRFSISPDSTFVSVQELVSFYKDRSMVDSHSIAYRLKKPVNTSSLKATTIKTRINELGHSEESGFSDEYLQLAKFDEENKDKSKGEGFKAANRGKNRFKNILPYDDTRVILKDPVPPPLSDYVNASYVKPELRVSDHNVYIASQGPLQSTVVDFWRMIWQEKVEIIAMTTKEVEGGKNKCARYWATRSEITKQVPIGETGGAGFVIRFIEETLRHDYTLTKMEVSHTECKEPPRTLYHFQYLSWPDHSAPQDPGSILTLLRDINAQVEKIRSGKPRPGPPIVVHCSAGIGRTGTLIILDILIHQLRIMGLNSDLDIFRTARNLRAQRPGMIQTEVQYRFVYMAILKFIETESKQSKSIDEVYCT